MKKTILLLAALVMTSCSGTYDLVYNQPVDTITTTINYQYGIYGFGYYDTFGRFYGPNNILFYAPTISIRPRRNAVSPAPRGRSRANNTPRSNGPKRPKVRSPRSTPRGGSGGRSNVPKAQ